MSRDSLESAIERSAPIIIDTSTILAYLDGTEATSQAAAHVLDALVRSGRNLGLISSVTVTETLVRPFRSGSSEAVGTAETFLRAFLNLVVVPVDHAIAREAARVRASSGLPTPDAMIIASAIVSGTRVLAGNDTRWKAALPKIDAGLIFCHLRSHAPL